MPKKQEEVIKMCENDKGDLALAVLEPSLVQVVDGIRRLEETNDHLQDCPSCRAYAQLLRSHRQNHTPVPIQTIRKRVMIGG